MQDVTVVTSTGYRVPLTLSSSAESSALRLPSTDILKSSLTLFISADSWPIWSSNLSCSLAYEQGKTINGFGVRIIMDIRRFGKESDGS